MIALMAGPHATLAAWAAGFDDPEFWNPKVRSPNCFNAPAARTELPQYLKRTEWVRAGASKQQMIERTRSAVADHSFRSPEPKWCSSASSH